MIFSILIYSTLVCAGFDLLNGPVTAVGSCVCSSGAHGGDKV